jgi:chitodextrinase
VRFWRYIISYYKVWFKWQLDFFNTTGDYISINRIKGRTSMLRLDGTHKIKTLLKTVGATLVAGTIAAGGLFAGGRAYAACATPSTDYGKATSTLSVPAAATYRIWSRIMVPDSTNNTYLLEVDGGNCYNVGGGSISANTWVWVDYQSGSTTNKVQQSLSQGNHSLAFVGNKPGVKLDRVIAVSDTTCVPTGTGDNCNVPSDTTPPAVTLTAPVEGASISGTVPLTASASDNVGVTKVEFYDNSSLVGTDTSSPYSVNWDSSKILNGSHLITARAYDAAGNVSSDSNTVTTKNGDIQAPSVPSSVKATATSYNAVNVTWKASTDNTAVTGYNILRDGVPVAKVGATTTYNDTGLAANTAYTYQVQAFDAAGNTSASSSKVSVTTQKVADSTPPTKATNLAATAASQTQVNLTWTAGTDNIGIVSYDVYRSTGAGDPAVVGSSTTTSFGDSNLSPNTTYAYYVVAKDASGNVSPPSDTATVKTLAPPPVNTQSSITGTITNQSTGKPIPYARVIVTIDSHRHHYQADRLGRYAIFNLNTGRYNLTFRAKGYYSKTVSVELGTSPLTQDMALKKR